MLTAFDEVMARSVCPQPEASQPAIDIDLGGDNKRQRVEHHEADEVMIHPTASKDSAALSLGDPFVFDDQFSFFDGSSCDSLLDSLFGGDATKMDEGLAGLSDHLLSLDASAPG
jgi:hypothetical protein